MTELFVEQPLASPGSAKYTNDESPQQELKDSPRSKSWGLHTKYVVNQLIT